MTLLGTSESFSFKELLGFMFFYGTGAVRKPHHRCQFSDFYGISEERLYRCRPYGAKGSGQTLFYTDTVPTGLKKFLESSRFLRSIRFGWETESTGPGETEAVIFSKIDIYSAVRNADCI